MMVRDAVAALELPRDPTQRIRLPESSEKREENAFTLGKYRALTVVAPSGLLIEPR
ncbi:MAG: hypothetical protein MJE77_38510 [Proteobacteria bacterium]|nr:hypothetical protein [Pseudomonadota bacterium]